MNEYGMLFHHLGLAVQSPKSARAFLSGSGYSGGKPVFDEEQKVYVEMWVSEDDPDIEIVSPDDTPGPLEDIFRRMDAGFYHVCYETTDAAKSVRRMNEDGLKVVAVSPAKPARLFGSCQVSFHVVDGFGLIELLEAAPGEE